MIEMAVDTGPTEQWNNYQISQNAGSPAGKMLPKTASFWDQSATSDLQLLNPSQDNVQQPTPSPTPSPRSDSPSTVATDLFSGERDSRLKHMNGDKRSQSFEASKPKSQNGEFTSEPIMDPQPPILKQLPPHELHDIPEERPTIRHRRKVSVAKSTGDDKILKLTPTEMQELTSAEESLPLRASGVSNSSGPDESLQFATTRTSRPKPTHVTSDQVIATGSSIAKSSRLSASSRSISTTGANVPWSQGRPRATSPTKLPTPSGPKLESLNLETPTARHSSTVDEPLPSPTQEIPQPPLLSTYLQLELASSRPSPLYIHRSSASEYPYESSKVKFERLLNFLLLPPQLEHVLLFGSLSCLDAWLHTFTILPLRFVKAVALLMKWWGELVAREARFISDFIYHGSGRMWDRRRGRSGSSDSTAASRSGSQSSRPSISSAPSYQNSRPETNGNAEAIKQALKSKSGWRRAHGRTKSQPSTLSSYHKADILQGLVIICSCIILMYFDASRMYHSIRGQSTTKLYVIYNVLEVADRLFAALGQDIFECLLCDETLGRVGGRSKILRPFWMFILALIYTVIHSTSLLYQVITLNVAVNSYSNALLTLLLSNQFVEIKGTVFKKIEKQNLFQLTCADIVERFQLWMMLVIIGLRNIVEVGGLSIIAQTSGGADGGPHVTVPMRSPSMLPYSFTILPNWTGEVLSPFLVVLGSELVVDWLKHAYIGKFNNIKPVVYQKFLDVLAKDYYTNAFVNQNLVKRLGLPVIPLSCLFIRSVVQTYYMFLANHLPTPIPSTATSLSLETVASATPVATAALEHFDAIIRKALGRSTFGNGDPSRKWYMLESDDVIAIMTMAIFFLCVFLVLLACKLVLGLLLLRFARNRYGTIKQRETLSLDTKGRRLGVLGIVEMDDDKRRMIYEGDMEGVKVMKEAERKVAGREKETEKGMDFGKIVRYEMAAKRIW